jgi:hypothetical protein
MTELQQSLSLGILCEEKKPLFLSEMVSQLFLFHVLHPASSPQFWSLLLPLKLSTENISALNGFVQATALLVLISYRAL